MGDIVKFDGSGPRSWYKCHWRPFQTSYMKKLLNTFPSWDLLFKLCWFSCVCFLIVDNLLGHSVDYALVKDERMVTITSLFQEFRAQNPAAPVITVIIN